MCRWVRPSTLLAQAIRRRTVGDLPGEERLLQQCIALGGVKRRQRTLELEAVRTARFYRALTQCQRGQFLEADNHLAELGLAARLSDAIWTGESSGPIPEDFFVHAVDDGLPPALVEQVREHLTPESTYWAEHQYDDENVAFYSHAHHIGEEVHVVDQLIEALRPLLKIVAPEIAASVTMAEWWAHHRRPDQWHGHPLHFDTDEHALRTSRGGRVRHPAISTVVYLSDDSERFGPTLVTNQRARESASTRAEVATTVRPRMGRALFFDGAYLHGALPGRPWLADDAGCDRRLCIMVGWWTCPMSPLPPQEVPQPLMQVDPTAPWVQSLCSAPSWQPVGSCKPVQLHALRPIWNDVPAQDSAGLPFSGRFFLTHREQIDDDMFL